MSLIDWVNREAGDGFAEAYGDKAFAARQLVDLAIADWSFVIQNFNYLDLSHTNAFRLTVIAEDLSQDPRATNAGGVTILENKDVDANGKPFAAIIKLDNDAAGSLEGPWFFAEKWINAYSPQVNDYRGISSTITGVDFYSVIHHELGHALGFAFPFPTNTALKNHLSPVDASNPNTAIRALQNFVGGPVADPTKATFNGGHLWPGFDPVVPLPLIAHPSPNDLMDSTPSTMGVRQMITPLDARILRDAYDYTICDLNVLPKLLTKPPYFDVFCTYYDLTLKPGEGCIIQAILHPPKLDPIAAMTVKAGELLTFRAGAQCLSPGQVFQFSLEPGSPPGATIHPNTGDFRWTPPNGPATIAVTIRVGTVGNLSDTATFSVTITE